MRVIFFAATASNSFRGYRKHKLVLGMTQLGTTKAAFIVKLLNQK